MRKDLTYTNAADKQQRSRSFFVFAVVFVVLASAVALVFLFRENDFDVKKFIGMREESTTQESVPQITGTLPAAAVITAPKDEYNFLLICGDEEYGFAFMAEIGVFLSTSVLEVRVVSPARTLQYNGQEMTIARLFKEYPYDLVSCYAENSSRTVDKYLRITTDRFKKMMAELGSVSVSIPNDIEYIYDGDIYTFRAGDLSLTSDLLLKYMTLTATGEELLKLQADVLVLLLKTHFTDRLYIEGEEYFSSFISYFTTDISIYDFREASSIINAFIVSGPTIRSEY
ncbi:MAG: hypothetical protein IJO14_00050 [Clostridia bacterium]|nr:hypothetical protein [Clostridia bacterium]